MEPNPSSLSDSELVKQAHGGAEKAFETLIERHAGLVFSIARAHVEDPETAEDLMQEIFLRAHLSLGDLRNPSRLAPWLARLTRNLAIDWLRRNQRRSRLVAMVPLDEEAHEVPDTQSVGATATMDAKDQSSALWRAVEQLPPEQRELVLLHFAESMEQREIARRLGVHPSTVCRQLRLALDALRTTVDPALRESAPTLHVPKSAVHRTAALVCAATAMSGAARSALASAAAASAPPAVESGVIGTVSFLAAKIAAGGMLMTKGKAAIAVGLIVLVGLFGYVQLKSSSSSTRPSTMDQVAVGEPVLIRLDLGPGTAWTETLRFFGRVQPEIIEDGFSLNSHFVTNRRVLGAVGSEEIQVESTVREAGFELTPWPQGDTSLAERRQRLVGHRVVTTVDHLGAVTAVDWGPDPSATDGLNLGATVLSLLTSGCPDAPMRPGETLTHELHLDGEVAIVATIRETLIGVESIDGQRVARVRKEIVAETGPLAMMGQALPVTTSGQRYEVQSECRYLLGENRPLSEEGILTLSGAYRSVESEEAMSEEVELNYSIDFDFQS